MKGRRGRGQEAAGGMTVPRSPSFSHYLRHQTCRGPYRIGAAELATMGLAVDRNRKQGGALSLEKAAGRAGSLSQLFFFFFNL